MKHAVLVFACVGALARPAVAQEPVGCDKFKWPIEAERALLTAPAIAQVTSGGALAAPPVAANVALTPFAQTKLPLPPERAPKAPDTFAGFVRLAAPPRPGTYKVTLAAEGWIDLVQDGRLVKSQAFSGATGCDGVRKSVKFELAAQPFTIQFSGMRANAIRLAVTPD